MQSLVPFAALVKVEPLTCLPRPTLLMALLLLCAAHGPVLVLTSHVPLSQLIHLSQVTMPFLCQLRQAPLRGSVMRFSFVMTIPLTSVCSSWVALQVTKLAHQACLVPASVAKVPSMHYILSRALHVAHGLSASSADTKEVTTNLAAFAAGASGNS